MSELKWIKITTSMFDDEKIKIIESMPDGDTILVIWVKLLIQAMKTFSQNELDAEEAGYVYLSRGIPYSEATLTTIFNRPQNTLKLAIATFVSLNMIELEEDGKIFIPRFVDHQNIEALIKTRLRVRKHRQKKLLTEPCNAVVTHVKRFCNATDKDLDKEVDLDKEKDLSTNISTPPPSQGNDNLQKQDKPVFAIIDSSYISFKNLIKKDDNPVGVLIQAFKAWHSDAPNEDFEDIGGRIGGIAKSVNKDYGYVLKLMWDACSVSIAGSHLNYIQGIIRDKKKREQQAGVRQKIRQSDPGRFTKGKYGDLVQR